MFPSVSRLSRQDEDNLLEGRDGLEDDDGQKWLQTIFFSWFCPIRDSRIGVRHVKLVTDFYDRKNETLLGQIQLNY